MKLEYNKEVNKEVDAWYTNRLSAEIAHVSKLRKSGKYRIVG